MRKRRTLGEMAQSAISGGDGIACPKCGCRDFRIYGTSAVTTDVRFRYKQCRHCGQKILTTTKSVERIIREVDREGEDDGLDGVVLRLA